jgi:hypothetical protein
MSGALTSEPVAWRITWLPGSPNSSGKPGITDNKELADARYLQGAFVTPLYECPLVEGGDLVGSSEPPLTAEEHLCLDELSGRLFDECQHARKTRGESRAETLTHDSLSRLRRLCRALEDALHRPLERRRG